MTPRVVIHAGMHKTATKSLQNLLDAQRPLLRAHGVCYPFTRFHHGSLLRAKHPDWDPSLCRDALDEAAESASETLVVSGETVSTLSEQQLHRLVGAFRGSDVTFVICMRPWADFLPSRWAQNCLRRDSQTFDAYLAALRATDGHPDLRFDLILDRMLATGAAVRAVSYSNALTAPGGVIAAVLGAMDLPTPLVDALLQSDPAWRHRRMTWQNVELCRLLNGSRAHRAGLPQDELFRSLGECRPCLKFFDTDQQLDRLAPPLRETLAEAIAGYRTECMVDSAIVPRAVRHRLQDAHGGLFVNRVDGRAFADESTVRVTCTSVAWAEFSEAHRPIIDAALAQPAGSKRVGSA